MVSVNILPEHITAGVTLDFAVTLTAYPAPDWSLQLLLRGPQAIDLTAVADDTQHRFTVAASITADYVAGDYWFSLRASQGSEVELVDEGQIRIRPDLAQISEAYDGRSHVEKVLTAIEAVIEGRASIDQQSYQINNRSLSRTPIADLLMMRTKYRDELRRAKMAEKGQSLLGRKVNVRF